MFWLILVSLIWAFSFGLIKNHLAGLDPTALATVRLAFALLVFLPFLRRCGVTLRQGARLALIGAVQFGLMYALYLAAFRHIQAHEVALFTIFTPIYVTLFDSLLERRLRVRWLAAAALAALGAGVLLWQRTNSATLLQGFLLMQGSNACFAFGQIAYKRLRPALPAQRDSAFFAWLLAGGFAATAAYSGYGTDWTAFHPTATQWGVLLYLGAVASGVGFFLWNRGALLVNTGTLAVFNNLKIPLGVVCSLLFFSEKADFARVAASFAILSVAAWLAERKQKT
jgi:drug/metabolite transporter (DMT)-like permease